MGKKDLYRYYCTTEAKYIKEKVDVDNPPPTICKNGAGHIVNWASLSVYHKAPRKSDIGLQNVNNVLDNLTAVTEPNSNNDASQGFSIGSKWVNILKNDIYFCVRNTIGNAEWKKNNQIINAESVGISGYNVYKGITGDKLQIKNISNGSSKIVVIDDSGNDEIDIDIIEGNIVINNLQGAPSGIVVGTTDTQTLTNKTFTDNTTYFQNYDDNTKKIRLQLSNVTSGTTRVFEVPNANTTLVGTNVTQTITNKIINGDSNTITNINNSAIKSGAGIDATKIADGSVSNTEFQYLNGTTSSIQSQIDSHTESTTAHGVSGTLVGTIDTQTLTNKTFTDNTTFIQDELDNTKKLKFQISNITSGTTRTLTAPNFNTTILGTDSSQTITNKTIDADNNTITNIDNDNIKIGASISANKIADGTVSNTEFQYLNGVSSNIQAQFNNHTHTTSDITSGTFANARIAQSNVTQHQGAIDHGSITGLGDDDHTQYLLLIGRSGGQTIRGGINSGDDLILQSTSNASKGTIKIIDPIETNELDAMTSTLEIGKSTATKVVIANTSVITEVKGNLDVLNGLDVTGNITVTGTVDGRDIAIDGSNLDSHTASTSAHGVSGNIVGTSSAQILTNKTFTDSNTYFQDNLDNSKKLQLQLANLAPNTVRILTIPDGNTTVVGTNISQTLTNKTINASSNNLSNITNSNIQAGAGIDATKIAGGSVTNAEFNHLNGVTSDIQTQIDNHTGTSSAHGVSGSIVGTTDGQTISNKIWGDNLNMNNNKIINVGSPTGDNDVATKAYVDGIASGLDIKNSVVVTTVVDLNSNTSIDGTIIYTPTGGTSARGQITATLLTTDVFTVDGISFGSVDNGSRILIKNQSNADENGIYTTTITGTSLTLDRAIDFDSDPEVTSGTFMFIEQGDVNSNTGWVLTTDNPIIIGGDLGTNLTFSQFSGAGSFIAGNGLSRTGNTLDTNLKTNGGIVLETNNLAVDLGASSITGTLSVSDGGTGATTFSSGNFLQGNGSGAITAIKAIPSGDVVGTTDSQILTNKTIDADNNTVSNIDDTNIKTGANIDVTKIGDGSISNIEFGYLNGVTSSIQTQIDNHITNTSNPHSVTKTQIGLANVQNIKVKLDATVAPTSDNDISEGYVVGSRWIDIANDKEYVCLDNTDGSAIWTETTSAGTAGEINTASNVGVSGISIYKGKSGVDLQFKSINSGSNKITIVDNVANNEVDIDVVESNIAIGNLNGAPSGTIVGTTDMQILTNKTFADDTTYFQNDGDNTKKLKLDLSNIATGTTRIFTAPDADITLVGTSTTQVLTNKTVNADNNTITNIDDGNIKTAAGIDATKIGDGSVSNTEFQYLNGTTSNIQTQIDNHLTDVSTHGVSGNIVGTSDTQVLTNKTFTDSTTYFQNDGDNTKKLQLQLSGITTGTTRTLTIPDTDTTIVGIDITQTLTNKTVDADLNTILNIDNDNIKTSAGIDATKIGDGSISNSEFQYLNGVSSNIQTQIDNHLSDTSTHGVTGDIVGTTDPQTLTNKTFTDNATYFQDNTDNTKKLQLQLANISTATTRTITIPDADMTIVGTNITQTLTNKTIDADLNTLSNIDNTHIKTSAAIDTTKIADGSVSNTEFQYLNGVTSNIQTQINNHLTDTSTHGVSGAIVGTTDTQTLTNKTWGDSLNMNGNKITNLATPTNDGDAVNKSYVDSIATGLDIKESVKVGTTMDLNSNSSISGVIVYNSIGGISSRGQITAVLAVSDTFTVDGVNLGAVNNGSRILVKNQLVGSQNGIYTITVSGISLTLDRSTDFDEDSEVTSGAFMFIEEGSINANTGWTLATDNPITIGGVSGTSLTFSQFNGSSDTVTAGTGLTKTGSVLDVNGSATIIANADNLEVNSSNTSNQVLLSSGTVGTASTFGALPLNSSNSITGTLGISNGGTGSSSFSTASRIVATNSANNALETTSLNPSTIITTTNSQTLTNKTIDVDLNTITNIDNGNIKSGAGIDASKIANGSVSNTEFQYLNGITGNVVSINNTQVLTNKTFTDNTTYFQDDLDNTKKLQFQLAGITTGTTRTLTIPDTNTTILGTNANQIITNKTIDADLNTMTNINNSNIKASAGIDASKIGDGSVSNTEFEYLNGVTSNIQTQIDTHTGTTTAHGVSGSIVGTTDTQILTNKTFTDNLTYFQDDLDNTKKLKFQLTNISTGTIRTLIIPNVNTTIVGTDATQTLTNKTIIGSSNTVEATQLATTGSAVIISGANPPSTGQVLKANSATTASWQDDTGGSGGVSRKFDAYYNPTSEISILNTWTDIPLDVNRTIDSNFTHPVGSAEITINTTDSYLVIARCTTDSTGGNRTESQMRLVINTGSGYTQIPGSLGSMYNRTSTEGANTATVSFIMNLNANDKIKMQALVISGNSALIAKSESCGITICKV